MIEKSILTSEIWHHSPTEDLIESNSVKECEKLYNSTKMTNKKKAPPSFDLKYPDFRFFCPSCGSLDVFLIWQESDHLWKSKCLDCYKNWYESEAQ